MTSDLDELRPSLAREREAAPRTSAGRALVEDEPRLVTGEHSMLVRVLAIEAEARQQMKAEVREQIFRDNGLIADPLAAASPAAPAVDVDLLQEAMERASGLLNMHFGPGRVPGWGVVAKYIAAEYQRLQDTVDPVATLHSSDEATP